MLQFLLTLDDNISFELSRTNLLLPLCWRGEELGVTEHLLHTRLIQACCLTHHSPRKVSHFTDRETETWRHEATYFVCLVAKSSPTLFCDPMDCGPPSSSVHGISQARILEWVAISSSKESS